MKTNAEEFEVLIEQCFKELASASHKKYDPEVAERTAALFLQAQFQLAYFIEDIELRARHSKTAIDGIEGEKYFEFKNSSSDGKKTDTALKQAVAKDKDVLDAQKANNSAEAELAKYKHLMNAIGNGHLFFRNLAKNNSKWE
jgi:hypothetical protein